MSKVRLGFVSNSSSSSFIVISDKGERDLQFKLNDKVLHVPESLGGETEFGWQIDNYNDIGSKINFCYLQALYSEKEEYFNMLENVLKQSLKIDKIDWQLSLEWKSEYYGYIDHQSSAEEGYNLEMFESEKTLENFIFNSESYIRTDNDNH